LSPIEAGLIPLMKFFSICLSILLFTHQTNFFEANLGIPFTKGFTNNHPQYNKSALKISPTFVD
tara:strand:- start:2806 stop:2997 length:192 start_codon:yes stop_codon:yes gene_type:complete